METTRHNQINTFNYTATRDCGGGAEDYRYCLLHFEFGGSKTINCINMHKPIRK